MGWEWIIALDKLSLWVNRRPASFEADALWQPNTLFDDAFLRAWLKICNYGSVSYNANISIISYSGLKSREIIKIELIFVQKLIFFWWSLNTDIDTMLCSLLDSIS